VEIKKRVSLPKMLQLLINVFPILQWGKTYNLQKFGHDFIAGVTLGSIALPQSMAYALLASLPPEFGLYASMIPAFVLLLFSRNPYGVIGPEAVLCLMLGNTLLSCVQNLEYNFPIGIAARILPVNELAKPWIEYPLIIPISEFIALVSGICFFLIFAFNLGRFFDPFIPNQLIAGFTGAASISIISSQLKGLIGVTAESTTGTFTLYKSYRNLYNVIDKINICAVIIGVGTMLLIWTIERTERLLTENRARIKYKLREMIGKNQKFPCPPKQTSNLPTPVTPAILISVIVMCGVSFFGKLNERYGLSIIGNIETDIPFLAIPWRIFTITPSEYHFHILASIIPKILSIILVSYCSMKSVSLTFPIDVVKKHISDDVCLKETLTDEFGLVKGPQTVVNDNESLTNPLDLEIQDGASMRTADVITDNESLTDPLDLEIQDDAFMHTADVKESDKIELKKNESKIWPAEKGDILSIGLSSIICSMASGFVVGPVISRSALLATQTNVQTQIANVVCFFFILMSIFFLTDAIAFIPVACLSGVVMYSMSSTAIKIKAVYALLQKALSKKDIESWTFFLQWISTFLAVVIFDPSIGIIVGIVLSQFLKFTTFILDKSRRN
jgi:MFS superfamily sulfate permease-like transporter